MFPIPYFSQPKLSLGPLTIHAFGVLVALAVIVGTEVLRRRAVQEQLDAVKAQGLVTWVLIGGFIGAHLVDRLVYFPRQTLEDPLSLLKFWSGLSSFGGFLGAVVGATLYIRKHPLRPQSWRYLDVVAYAFVFGWIFGRTGCFVAFDHPGIKTDFFLAHRNAEGVPIFNLGLLEALYFLPLAAIFYGLGKKRRGPGFFVGLLALLYVPFRFVADFARTVDVRYGGLTPGQWGTLALAVVGVLILRRAMRIGPQGDA